MALTEQNIANRLQSLGYEYFCFISWPHIGDREVTACAKKLKEEIENRLKSLYFDPKVFIDYSDIKGGMEWKKFIRKALLKSIAMVAVCAPIYYSETHKWCGYEWAFMDLLSKRRFPNESLPLIIPVMVRGEIKELPDVVLKKNPIDVTKILSKGRHYYDTNEFRNRLEEIINNIKKISSFIALNQIKPDCGNFKLPKQSAFAGYHEKNQSLPFRSGQ